MAKEALEKKTNDPVTEIIGEFGRWQAWVCLPNMLSSAIYLQQTLLTKFLTTKTDFWCGDSDYSTGITNETSLSLCDSGCKNWKYEKSEFQVWYNL